jgi:hypothetical protein
VAARWTDFVDPTREEVLRVLPAPADPDVVEALVADSGYWRLGVSVGLIVASTIAQLVLYRWRRWI